jgi:PilZ domain
MALAVWIRAALSRSDQWCVELERLRVALAAEPAGAQKIERTLDLAEATEHVEPDRTKALALYLSAWRAGHVGARSSVVALARELRAYMTVAEVALADHADTKDPESLVTAGRAYVDAGLFERATEIFVDAAAQHASLASAITTAPRLADVKVAVAKARFQKVDPEREIDGCMARAQQAGDAAAPWYLQAARIARLSKLERYGVILGLAARQCPNDEEIARLFEDTLLDSRSAEDFLVYHRRRLEAVQGEDAWVECVRAAACELVLRNVHPGLGLRMLRTSIEHAYNAKLTDGMRRHIAAWELLVAAAKTSSSTVSLAPLVADGLRAELAPDDAIYIARLGLEIAWRDAKDTVAAQPYAAALLDRVPGHPLAAEFLGEIMPAPPAEPVLPRVTFRIPVIKRDVSPIPAPPTPPPDATSRAKRMVVPVDVVIELPTGGFFSAMLRDLSASGAFVTTKRALEVGTVVSLEIRLPGSRVLSEQNFRIDARIARRTELGWGLAFIAPPPELVAGITALVD